jgi:hypothetical protein
MFLGVFLKFSSSFPNDSLTFKPIGKQSLTKKPLMVFSSKFLAKCSVYIAIGGLSSVMIMRSILIDKVRRQEYYQSAMKETRNSEGEFN